MAFTGTVAVVNDAGKDLLGVILAKSAEACYVEWIVGTVLAFVYVGVPAFGWATIQDVLHLIGIWPLIAALACTRLCDTMRRAVGHIWSDTDGQKAA